MNLFKKKWKSGGNINVLRDIPLAKSSTKIGFGFIFVKQSTPQSIMSLMFECKTGPFWLGKMPVETINICSDNWKWEHVAVSCGFFDSLSNARRGGWAGDIEDGINERKYKRKGQVVWAYSPPKAVQ